MQTVVEKGVEIEKKEPMMILRCKMKSANFAIYHELNNRVVHKLLMSVYVFERGMHISRQDSKQNPLNAVVLRDIFKVNKSVIRTKYVDNKVDRKRGIARQIAKEKDYEGG